MSDRLSHLAQRSFGRAGDREDCPACDYRGAVKWNPFNRVVQCHNCGEIVEAVTMSRSAMLQLMGQVALPPFKDHPEASSWDCAPMAEDLIEVVEELFSHGSDDS